MRCRIIAAGLIVSTLATACSPGSSASPPPTAPATGVISTTTSSTSTTVASEPPRPTKAPPVTRTLDILTYRERACDLLTREQQATLDLPRPENHGGLCRWTQPQPKLSITVDLLIDLNYLAQVYLQSNQENSTLGRKEWVVFEPITVGGQPAVVLNATTDRTYSSVLVGTSPDDAVDVSVTTETGADPRATAIAITEQIVNNLTK